MSTIRKYIIVDDDPFNNFLCNMTIEDALGEVEIKTFEVPEDGLEFLQNEYAKTTGLTILFLDINMPTLTGWEFMEAYEKFSETIKMRITVYLVSSSLDQHDKEKAKANESIKGFISKPMQEEMILSLARINNG